eukprot:1391685-Prymnesium_polylepis.1
MWGQEEEDVVWVRVKRKLGSVLAAIDKLIEGSIATEQAGKPPPDAPPPVERKPPNASSLQPDALETLRRVCNVPPNQRTHDDVGQMIHVLRGSEILLRLDELATAAIVGGMRWDDYVQGAAVVPADCTGDSYLMVTTGSLSVFVRDRDASGSASRRISYLYPGESFGEASFGEAGGGRVIAEVRAAQPSSVMRVTRLDFHAAMRN